MIVPALETPSTTHCKFCFGRFGESVKVQEVDSKGEIVSRYRERIETFDNVSEFLVCNFCHDLWNDARYRYFEWKIRTWLRRPPDYEPPKKKEEKK